MPFGMLIGTTDSHLFQISFGTDSIFQAVELGFSQTLTPNVRVTVALPLGWKQDMYSIIFIPFTLQSAARITPHALRGRVGGGERDKGRGKRQRREKGGGERCGYEPELLLSFPFISQVSWASLKAGNRKCLSCPQNAKVSLKNLGLRMILTSARYKYSLYQRFVSNIVSNFFDLLNKY